MRFKFQIVDSAKFDKLPGKNMHENIGVAYPEKNEAYIRHSGNTMFDTFTVAHELEHLKGSDNGENYDTEFKCYYRRGAWYNPFGGNFLGDDLHQYIAPLAIAASMFVPGLWPGVGSALSGLGGSLASGASVINPALGGAMASLGAPLAGAGNAIGGMMGAGGAGSQAGYAANAGRMGQGMGGGFGIGSGTAAGSAAASGGGGSVLGSMASAAGKNYGSNALMGMFGSKPSVIQPQQQMRNTNFGGGRATQPQQPQSSVVNPGSPGGSSGDSGGMMNIDPGLREKIQGWFGGRSPQEAFSSQRSQGQGFGRGNTSFGGF